MLNTEYLSVAHEQDCSQKGELCICIKRELIRLFEILNNYQDEVMELNKKILEMGEKNEKKKITKKQIEKV